jgi:hypothetical protein
MYNNRQGVQTAMLDAVQSALSPIYADVAFLELNNIELPPEYNAAVGEKVRAYGDLEFVDFVEFCYYCFQIFEFIQE